MEAPLQSLDFLDGSLDLLVVGNEKITENLPGV